DGIVYSTSTHTSRASAAAAPVSLTVTTYSSSPTSWLMVLDSVWYPVELWSMVARLVGVSALTFQNSHRAKSPTAFRYMRALTVMIVTPFGSGSNPTRLVSTPAVPGWT